MSSRSAITLRIVAGERSRMWRRATEREPTGSALSTYSAMMAIRTCRLRSSREASAMLRVSFYEGGAESSAAPAGMPRANSRRRTAAGGTAARSEQLGEQRVGEEEAVLGEARPPGGDLEEPALAPGREHVGEPAALERDALVEPRLGNAVGHAQAEDQALAQPLPLGERLVRGDRQHAGLQRRAVPLQRLRVRIPHRPEKATRTRPEPEVLLGAPVDLVVGGPAARPREVGDLVVLEAGVPGARDEPPVLRRHGVLRGQPGHRAGAPQAALVERE